MAETTRTEEFKVSGEDLLNSVKKLINEGNVRRIVIKDKDGITLFEIPLMAGIAATVLMPVLVAIGAIAALATNYTIVVERVEKAG